MSARLVCALTKDVSCERLVEIRRGKRDCCPWVRMVVVVVVLVMVMVLGKTRRGKTRRGKACSRGLGGKKVGEFIEIVVRGEQE